MTPTERKRKQRHNEKIIEAVESSDDAGRLHNERSGEGPRKHGQSEIERVINVAERLDQARPTKPEGSSPDTFEVDPTADRADGRQGQKKPGKTIAEERLDERMDNIAIWLFDNPSRPGCCRRCGLEVLSNSGRHNHAWEAYRQKEKLERHRQDLIDADAPADMIGAARKACVDDKHFQILVRLLAKRNWHAGEPV